MKQAVVVLLPVVWLVTVGYVSFESSPGVRLAEPTEAGRSTSGAAPESGDICWFANDQTRHVARRLFPGRSQDKETPGGLVPTNRPSAPPQVIAAVPLAGPSSLLQQRWQFLWRTAASPRAPASLA
ncbi:MAG: hypothetical protein P4N60_20745 [Verrucomicrobiae bacterium]|nr:hypothetical protein [Verrucomicrobiae bacterium]